jgi:hypothetical protein
MQSALNVLPKRLSIAIDDNAAAAVGTLTSDNTQVTTGKKVTIDTTVYTFKVTSLTEAKSTTTLTSDETNVSNNDVVVLGSKTYTFKTTLTEKAAAVVLTSDNTNPVDGDTVTIGTRTFTFTTDDITGYDRPRLNRIKIGANADTTLGNLIAAINGEAGSGTKYSAGTLPHALVSAGTVSSHTTTITALTKGVAGNSIVSTETSSHLSFAAATLLLGADAVANEVKRHASDADTSLANLVKAINGTGTEGTEYSTGTTNLSSVLTAGAVTSHATVITANAIGIALNSYATTTTAAHLSYTSTVMVNGAAAVPYEVLIGADADGSLNNLIAAINGAAGAGTTYGTGTVAHPTVTAGTVTAHAFVVTARTAGIAGNLIATTEDDAHLSWGAVTLASGGSTIGTSDPIGKGGGKLSALISIAPQWAGTPTYTIEILNASGEAVYTSGALNENATTRTVVEQMVNPTDYVRITTSTKVSEAQPLVLELR